MEKVRLMIVDEVDSLRKKLSSAFDERKDVMFVTATPGHAPMTPRETDVSRGQLVSPIEHMQSWTDPVELSAVTKTELFTRPPAPGMKFFIVRQVTYDALCDYCAHTESAEVRQVASLDDVIRMNCLRVGIPPNIQGLRYICFGVRMVVESQDVLGRITKELYPGIAARYDTTASKVERSIRHAISVVWTRGNPDAINQLFGFTVCQPSNKPTNGEFIGLMANSCRGYR